MADQDISVFLRLKDSVSGGLHRVGNALDGVYDGAKSVAAEFSTMSLGGITAFGVITAGAAKAVAAVAELTKEGIELNRQFENTSIRIAGTLKAFDVTPTFAKAQAQAAGVMNTIAELAAKLPGETEDYITVFATALPKVISAGLKDTQRIAEFTSHYTAVASSNMVDAQQAGMDLFRMLAGQAGADVRMWVVLAEKIGMTTEAFNKLPAATRLAEIQKAISAFDAQLIAAGDSYDAKAGEMASRIKEIKRVASEVAFDQAKQHLEDMNHALKANRQELVEASAILTSAYQSVSDSLEGVLTGWKILGARLVRDFAKFGLGLGAGAAAAKVAAAGTPGAQAAEQQAEIDRRLARTTEYKEEGYERVVSLLPEKLRRPMLVGGAGAILTPEIEKAFISLGQQRRKTDTETALKIMDYLEFMGADSEMLYYRIFGGLAETGKKKAITPPKLKAPKVKPHEITKAPETNFYNNRFDIKQEFAEGFDPDRIAVAFSQDLARVGEMKVQSGYAPLFSGR